jgi:hypothetical protein
MMIQMVYMANGILNPSTSLFFTRFSSTKPNNELPLRSNSSARRIGSERLVNLAGGQNVYEFISAI